MEETRRELTADPAPFLRRFIQQAVLEGTQNRLGEELGGAPIYEEPLVGFADGEDPLFYRYQEIIGPFHLTPAQVIEGGQPGIRAQSLSVICWALPIARPTRLSNRRERVIPSPAWAHTREHGEVINNDLRRKVVALLEGAGFPAVAPMRSPLFKFVDLPSGRCSTWSERHALYAAGMGSFGLSDGLITEKGMAMRCGSVVTTLPVPPTPRRYESHTESCLFFLDRSCTQCIRRCPVGAITEQGHNKIACREYLLKLSQELAANYRLAGETGCGLCQTGVPCEFRIPKKATPPPVPR